VHKINIIIEYILNRDINKPKFNFLKKGRENIEWIAHIGKRVYPIVDKSNLIPFKRLIIKASKEIGLSGK